MKKVNVKIVIILAIATVVSSVFDYYMLYTLPEKDIFIFFFNPVAATIIIYSPFILCLGFTILFTLLILDLIKNKLKWLILPVPITIEFFSLIFLFITSGKYENFPVLRSTSLVYEKEPGDRIYAAVTGTYSELQAVYLRNVKDFILFKTAHKISSDDLDGTYSVFNSLGKIIGKQELRNGNVVLPQTEKIQTNDNTVDNSSTEEYSDEYSEEGSAYDGEIQENSTALCDALDNCAKQRPWKKSLVLQSPIISFAADIMVIVHNHTVYYYAVEYVDARTANLYTFRESEQPRFLGSLEYGRGGNVQTLIDNNDIIVDINGQRLRHRAGSDTMAALETTDRVIQNKPNHGFTYECYSPDSSHKAISTSDDSSGTSLTIRNMTNNTDSLIFRERSNDWFIIHMCFSSDGRSLYFDNLGAFACIWEYNLGSDSICKIIPEHEAGNQFVYDLDGIRHVVYLQGDKVYDAVAE